MTDQENLIALRNCLALARLNNNQVAIDWYEVRIKIIEQKLARQS